MMSQIRIGRYGTESLKSGSEKVLYSTNSLKMTLALINISTTI